MFPVVHSHLNTMTWWPTCHDTRTNSGVAHVATMPPQALRPRRPQRVDHHHEKVGLALTKVLRQDVATGSMDPQLQQAESESNLWVFPFTLLLRAMKCRGGFPKRLGVASFHLLSAHVVENLHDMPTCLDQTGTSQLFLQELQQRVYAPRM